MTQAYQLGDFGQFLTVNVSSNAISLNSSSISTISNTFTIGNSVYHVSNGNMGIGTSSPAYLLDVSGSYRAKNANYTFTMPNVGGTASWIKLGTFTAAQDGEHIFIKVVTSAGFNADPSQQIEMYIHFKTSNYSSVDANGFAGDATFYILNSYQSNWNVKVVSNAAGISATAFDIYFYQIAPFNGAGAFYTVEIGNQTTSTWTHVGSLTSDPGSASSTLAAGTPRYLIQSNTGIGNSTPTTKLSVGGTTYLGGNVTFTQGIIDSTGTQGTAGQVLTSNGTGNVYWSTIVGTNTAAQYTWSNTQTFSNTITFNGSLLANTVNASSYTTGGGYGSVTGGITVNSSIIGLGNSTVNTTVNSTSYYIQNTTSNLIMTPSSLTIGNSTVNTTVNSTGFGYTNSNPGYVGLPGGIKINFGLIVANSIGSNTVTFSSAFSTNAYGISLTPYAANATYVICHANGVTKSGFTIYCGNTTAMNNTGITGVYYTAIGF